MIPVGEYSWDRSGGWIGLDAFGGIELVSVMGVIRIGPGGWIGLNAFEWRLGWFRSGGVVGIGPGGEG